MNKKDHIFKEIFDKSPIGIFCYDKKGNLIDANPTALKIAGIDSIDNFKKVNFFKKYLYIITLWCYNVYALSKR